MMRLVYVNGFLLEKQPHWKERARFLADVRTTLPFYIFFHDRSGHFPNELNIKTLHEIPRPRAHMPAFADLLQRLIDAFILRVLESGRRVYVAYSGGIDSTAVMCAILRSDHFPRLKRERALLAGLTGRSIDENPEFFYRSVSKECEISAIDFSRIGDPGVVYTGGEYGDQLVASLMIDYLQERYGGTDRHLLPWLEGLNDYIKSGSFRPSSMAHFESFAETAPFPLRNSLQYWWWFDFCTKWQEIYFRAYRWSRHHLTEEQLRESIYYPFASVDFQQWAMAHMADADAPRDYRRSKAPMLDFIYAYNHDRDYYDHKIKIPSQRYTGRFVYKNGVREDFSSIWDINTGLGLFT